MQALFDRLAAVSLLAKLGGIATRLTLPAPHEADPGPAADLFRAVRGT